MTKRAQQMLRLMDRAVSKWHIPVIGKEKGRVIKRLLAKHAPTRGIEVGSLFGYSAILLAANMPRGGHLTCVENNAYLARKAVEPRLVKSALIIADNTGIYRRDVKPYIDHVRSGGAYTSREYDFGFDCMEVSVFNG